MKKRLLLRSGSEKTVWGIVPKQKRTTRKIRGKNEQTRGEGVKVVKPPKTAR